MFVIQCQATRNGLKSDWFPVFSTFDGNDAADFLKRLVDTEVSLRGLPNKELREYNLIWAPEGDPRLCGPGKTDKPSAIAPGVEPMLNFDDLERDDGDDE